MQRKYLTFIYNKNSQYTLTRRKCLQIHKQDLQKPIGSPMLISKRVHVFPLRWGRKKRCLLLITLFNIKLDILAISARQKQNLRESREEETKLLFTDGKISYIENHKESTRSTWKNE
jgi:hypothetical protein